jgi:hypothetical protein
MFFKAIRESPGTQGYAVMMQLDEEQLQLDEVTHPPEMGTILSSSCSKTKSSAVTTWLSSGANSWVAAASF